MLVFVFLRKLGLIICFLTFLKQKYLKNLYCTSKGLITLSMSLRRDLREIFCLKTWRMVQNRKSQQSKLSLLWSSEQKKMEPCSLFLEKDILCWWFVKSIFNMWAYVWVYSKLWQYFWMYFQVRDGRPVYTSIDPLGHMSEFTVELLVADGLWHILSLLTSGRNNSLYVDDKMVLNITQKNMDLRLFSLEKIILGGAPPRQIKLQQTGNPMAY